MDYYDEWWIYNIVLYTIVVGTIWGIIMEKENKQKTEEEEKKKAEEESKKEETGKTIIDNAEEVAERIENANKETKALLDRQEALAAKQSLGGGSEGGIRTPKETSDEKWAREAKLRYEGTGMDPT